MQRTSKTRTSTPRLSEIARHVIVPEGAVKTGWPSVQAKARDLGVEFDGWQVGAGRVILAKRADGKYAAAVGGVVMSLPRQVGKTYLIGAIVFALCLIHPGLTVLWTAHRLRTAEETFAKMQSFAGRRKVRPHIKQIVLGSGDQAVLFINGSRILFGARERGFGRGFDDVDVEVFDEAQILTENATDDMLPAMNASPNALPIFIGTPPKPKDQSEVFTGKRKEALSGEDLDTAYIEFSADEDADPDDRRQWAKANPSFPERTSETAMLRMKKHLTPESFRREALGIWDREAAELAIEPEVWERLVDRDCPRPSPIRLAVAVSEDRKFTTIAMAGRRADGFAHIEVIDARRGSDWLVDRLKQLRKDWRPKGWVLVEANSPAAALVPDLVAAKIRVREVSVGKAAAAETRLVDAIAAEMPTVRHSGQKLLGVPVGVVTLSTGKRVRLEGPDGVDVSPLRAVALAHWALLETPSTSSSSGVVEVMGRGGRKDGEPHELFRGLSATVRQ